MKVENYLNTTKKEIEEKKFNIWLGISLGNKYFSKENIEKYILFALQYTKDDVLVVIGDALYAYNIQYLDGRSSEGALRKAKEIGKVSYTQAEEVIKKLTKKDQKRVRLVNWNDVAQGDEYMYTKKVIYHEFDANPSFHDYVIECVKEGRKDREESLTPERLKKLAAYVLDELPFFVDGIHYNSKIYTLILYPGIGLVDTLATELQEGTLFPELTKKLKFKNKTPKLEVYP